MTAIDLFAGLGGFTEAATSAGVRVLWAANHWQAAVEIHAANHPETAHACQDLHQADWEQVPRHDLLLASPCCQGHAKARGKDRPHHDKSRSTAWAVVSCAEFHRPTAVVVENVPEFQSWALFPAWRQAMEALGYSLSLNVFDAADTGTPQNRERLLIVGTRSRHPLTVRAPGVAHVPAASFIQWDAWPWSPINRPGRSVATLNRIAAGRRSFGDRFVIPYYGSGSGLTGRSLDRPLGTVTTRDRWALIDGDRMRMLQVPEYRAAMGFRDDYVVPLRPRHVGIHMLGNAVPPLLAAHVIAEVRRAA
jgi:DNA (cytosine-5)-methyltransferase 1